MSWLTASEGQLQQPWFKCPRPLIGTVLSSEVSLEITLARDACVQRKVQSAGVCECLGIRAGVVPQMRAYIGGIFLELLCKKSPGCCPLCDYHSPAWWENCGRPSRNPRTYNHGWWEEGGRGYWLAQIRMKGIARASRAGVLASLLHWTGPAADLHKQSHQGVVLPLSRKVLIRVQIHCGGWSKGSLHWASLGL